MDKVFYLHGELPDETRYTVAGHYVKTRLFKGITLGFSICSIKDQFCKKTGRIKAEGKMLSSSRKGNYSQRATPEAGHEARTFIAVAEQLLAEVTTRARLMEICRL